MENLIRDFFLAAGGGFGGGLIVLVGDLIIRYFHRPIITMSFDRNKHQATVITVDTTFAGVEGPGTWFRLRVSNVGKGTAKDCEVEIVKLVRIRPTPYTYENDPIGRRWSHIGPFAVDLHAKTSRFCDILAVRNDFFRIGDAAPNYLEKEVRRSYEGAEFNITLQVSGDNFAPVTRTIICGWEAGVQNIVAREV